MIYKRCQHRRAVFLGSNANNDTKAGFVASNTNNELTNTNTNIGSRNCYNNDKLSGVGTLPLGRTKENNRGFGRATEGDAQKQS